MKFSMFSIFWAMNFAKFSVLYWNYIAGIFLYDKTFAYCYISCQTNETVLCIFGLEMNWAESQ